MGSKVQAVHATLKLQLLLVSGLLKATDCIPKLSCRQIFKYGLIFSLMPTLSFHITYKLINNGNDELSLGLGIQAQGTDICFISLRTPEVGRHRRSRQTQAGVQRRCRPRPGLKLESRPTFMSGEERRKGYPFRHTHHGGSTQEKVGLVVLVLTTRKPLEGR